MVIKLLSLLFGYVRITVRGSTIERFLNICIKNEIKLYKIERKDEVCMCASLSISDFRKLMHYMGRTGCHVHITRKIGLPFFTYKLRKRYALWFGTVIAILLFFILTNCIWVIDIQISGKVDLSELRKNLNAAGAYTGVPIYFIDENKITQTVKHNMKTLDYISVSRLGNRLIIQAIDDNDAPEIQDDKAVTGIVASYDGVITNMDVKGGYPLVKVGDAVLKGDKLVTALTPPTTEQGTGHIGHSIASITADTLRTEQSMTSLTRLKKEYTGKTKTQFAILIGNFRINLYLGTGISGIGWEKTVSETQLHIGEGTYFPIKIIKQDYKKYNITEIAYPVEVIEQEILENAKARLENIMLSGEIKTLSYTSEKKDDALILNITAHCTEDIASEISEEGLTLPQKQTENPSE